VLRPVTLFTGQWTDIPFETICEMASEWGYEGLEIACWGGHFDVRRAVEDDEYIRNRLETLDRYGLKLWAISNHQAGQLVASVNDERFDRFAPSEVHGSPEKMREWAIEEMKITAVVAKRLGVEIVTGFTGSPIWEAWYAFPPIGDEAIDEGFQYTADLWTPILKVFSENGVKFALEVHPTEIAFDIHSSKKLLEHIKEDSFGFNFDPSHLYWQGIEPHLFIYDFADKIFHVHVKDAAINLDGRSGILGSHIAFGDARRGWNFVSPGRGGVDFELIIRALNDVGYDGPLSVEWEDNGMNREYGAREAFELVKKMDFPKSDIAFDASMKL